MRRPRTRKKRSAIVPATVFALAITVAVIPSLAGCGDESENGVADIGFAGVADIGFDLARDLAFSVADMAFRD